MPLAERFFIVGAGGHAQVVLAAWQAGCCSDYDFHCFLGQRDVDKAETLQGHPIRWQSPEALAELKKDGVEHFMLGVGSVRASAERSVFCSRRL
jgi:PglD N-terminal domain